MPDNLTDTRHQSPHLSAVVTDEDRQTSVPDEYGALYSPDGLRLLKGSDISQYSIRPGTKVICDNAFSGYKNLTSIALPDSVVLIGNHAFSQCGKLTAITIPDSVTEIGGSAFEGCSGLTSVTIPNSVTKISYAFSGCIGLTSVHITDIAKWCAINFGYGFENPLCYAHNLYHNGREIKDLTIPNSVTEIGSYAFYGCCGLTSVTIPDSVTKIGKGAFCDCSDLASVTIPDSVTEIGEGAFSRCSGLASVTIPNSVTKIGKGAFCDCSGLASVTIPDSVTEIGDYAFYGCSGLTSVTIPNSVTEIGEFAFYGCSGLKSVIWNAKTCRDFERQSHQFDIGIKSFVFGSEVEIIPARLCHGLRGLTSVTISDSVTEIGDYALRVAAA